MQVYQQGPLKRLNSTHKFSRKWKVNWFVWHLKGISFWESERDFRQDKAPKGILPMEDQLIVREHEASDDQRLFRIETASVVLTVKAKNEAKRNEWLTARAKAESEAYKHSRLQSLHHFFNDPNGFLEVMNQENPWEPEAGTTSGGFDEKAVNWLTEREGHELSLFENKSSLPPGPENISRDDIVDLLLKSPPNDEFPKVFFLNYVCFMTPDELCARLERAYDHQPSRQARVLTVFSEWLQMMFIDVEAVWGRIRNFAEKQKNDSSVGQEVRRIADALLSTLQQADQELTAFRRQRHRLAVDYAWLPKEGASMEYDVVSFEPAAVAAELTLSDSRFFRGIHPRELTRKEWKRPTALTRAPAVLRMIEIFNRRSYWVASEILRRETQSARVRVLTHMIHIADACARLRNFFGAYAILNGLSLSPVHRLKRCWNTVPRSVRDLLSATKNTLSYQANFGSYRRLLKEGMPFPQVPHLVVLLKDLFTLEETEHNGKDDVSWIKYVKQWSEIRRMLAMQIHHYTSLASDTRIKECLHLGVSRVLSEEELWKKSYQWDPRV